MNFAAMSGIDIVRFALTGGDRTVDEDSTSSLPSGVTAPRTVLQRAYLPGDETGTNGSFYGSGYFTTRTLAAGTTTNYLTPFGSSNTVYVKSCNNKIFFGTSDTGNCSAPGNNANLAVTNTTGTAVTGTFIASVQVCSASEGPNRPDLCQQYPSGIYKPVGEVQKNADKVRLAAFGYLIDQTGAPNERYGGVLRAPMKFVGAKQMDGSGVVSDNPSPEWKSDTGVFFTKPLSTTQESGFTTTGVVNYLNKFGRTGSPAGIYKQYDPVGELYYEAIRYFQNLGPSTGTGTNPTAGLTSPLDPTDTKLDGFPVYTIWSDPMQTACQRNFAMVVGDNNTHYDGQLPGSTLSGQTRAAIAANAGSGIAAFNADTWTSVVTSFETNGSVTYTDSQGVTRTANGNTAGTSSPNVGVVSGNTTLQTKATGSNNGSYLWAGLAYFANTQSIRSDKPLARVRTFVIDVDEGGNGDVNNTRSRSFYLAGKYGGFADIGTDGSPATGEGNPYKTYVGGTLTSASAEWLANDGSTSPSGYFLASQPDRMIAAIRKIFATASQPSGSLAGGSINVGRLNTTQQGGAFYQTQMNASDWSGTVIRTAVNYNTTTQQITAGTTPVWDAAKILTGIQNGTNVLNPVPVPNSRNIFSYSLTSNAGVTFTWANLDTAVQTSLSTQPTTGASESAAMGQARLDYLRGVRTGESDTTLNFRARSRIMGDSINSAPVLKGLPNTSIVDADYATFMSSNSGRTPTLYIGSNDGMLHAFYAADSATNTNNGKELFAYVPRAVSGKLNKLTDPAYVKDAYVDGAMTVDEAKIYRASSAATGWGTALVSGMGGGAKGVFALDVTSPSNFSAANVLWEFTNADDADMGNLLSEPKIVKLVTNGSSAATPTYQWFAMVSSGYNNYSNGGSNDKQALYLLALDKVPGTAWTLGTNYFKLIADNSTFAASSISAATGIAMPGVAMDAGGNTLLAYAGDLQGNLWRFDLRGPSTTWTGSSKVKVLFTAKNTAGTSTQPITVQPAITLNVSGGYQISFGTGKFIEPNDALSSSAAEQSLYGLWDSDDGKKFERVKTGSGSSTTNGLITRTLTVTSGTTTVTVTGSPFSYGTSTVSGSNQYRGWVVNLPTTMERVAVDPVVENGVMAINSTIPGGDPCVSTGGANQYRFNPSTGFALVTKGISTVGGYLGGPSILEVGDASWSTRSPSGRYTVTRKVNTISPGVSGGLAVQESTVSTLAGRISWREITSFQQ